MKERNKNKSKTRRKSKVRENRLGTAMKVPNYKEMRDKGWFGVSYNE